MCTCTCWCDCFCELILVCWVFVLRIAQTYCTVCTSFHSVYFSHEPENVCRPGKCLLLVPLIAGLTMRMMLTAIQPVLRQPFSQLLVIVCEDCNWWTSIKWTLSASCFVMISEVFSLWFSNWCFLPTESVATGAVCYRKSDPWFAPCLHIFTQFSQYHVQIIKGHAYTSLHTMISYNFSV